MQVIITSPEMCLQHDQFRKLLSTPSFAGRIMSIVIDEAHCISQWGKEFRPEYAQLGTLRAFVPTKVPVLITSVMLPRHVLLEVQNVMHIQRDYSYYVHRGTDRHNIAWFVEKMNGGKKDLDSLSFLVPAHHPSYSDIEGMPQTFVFFDEINTAIDALKYLRQRVKMEYRGYFQVYHSRTSCQETAPPTLSCW